MRYIDLVVIDEAHIPFMAYEQDFRSNLIALRRILQGTQTLFLSATIPPAFTKRFKEYYGLSGLKEIRKQTNRPNLKYSVQQQAGGITKQIALIKSLLSEHEVFIGLGKVIIYCRSKQVANDVGQQLGYLVYHAERDDEERVQTLEKFKGVGPDNQVIAATGALGGVWSLSDFAQESGRGGRDGNPALSIIINNAFSVSRQPQVTNQERHLLEYYNTTTCRRLVLSSFLDGTGGDCFSTQENMLCDLCQEKSAMDERELPLEGSVIRLASTLPGSMMSSWYDHGNALSSQLVGSIGTP
ncbi:hypothetical protein L211DRAFT_854605 [Terfezia boudieri ATCC MYA-4762]|uniref:P-loop containing nucleoside triphosphate hydrolase protein n=1 Tax=Terfezia boudieri ATCC MYA-4762 TaxID=1051890 RepID=A0A3N4LBG2_9PEZI|nr:hypothetical protein L211DRAFT_854605 [Terfezia boudieri ATCC MYA-4762]